MKKIMIIFGAGASYDVIDKSYNPHDKDFQPPLTNQLFDMRFQVYIDEMSEFTNRIPELRAKLAYNVCGLEEYLDNLKQKALTSKNKKIYFEFIEVLLYLQNIIHQVSNKYLKANSSGGITSNYHSFLKKFQDEQINPLLVTFNYDLYLDRACTDVFGKNFNTVDDYTNSNIKLYKVHGSVNWGYNCDVNLDSVPSFFDKCERYERLSQWIEKFDSRDIKPQLIQDYSESLYYPALAVPLKKNKGFVIPEYKKQLQEAIREIDTIVVVGWSASDSFFLDLIHSSIRHNQVSLFIVGNSHGGTQSIRDKFLSHNNQSSEWRGGPKLIYKGFSNFIADSDNIFEQIFH